MRTALLLNAVDPSIGGVLISGHKGTGKTTAVRGLAALMPRIGAVTGCCYRCDPERASTWCDDCAAAQQPLERVVTSTPFVELPLSATEDRLVGTLHVEEALRTGSRRFEPGLLAAANRGVLYVDEVNLLDDHLVDMLLDAAASGVNVVEREGISHVHPARFALIGTMNPEEGELRPQFLDRFGLSVAVVGLGRDDEREELVRRRLGFDGDPEQFCRGWEGTQRQLSERLVAACAALQATRIEPQQVSLAVRLAVRAGGMGHRAEVALLKTARALAALLGEPCVLDEHILQACHYVLGHRLPDVPLSAPELAAQRIHELVEGNRAATAEARQGVDDGDLQEELEAMQVPGSAAAGSILFDLEKKTLKTASVKQSS